MNRAATVECIVCGLRVVGVIRDGRVYASDRSRPAPDAPVVRGLCMKHAAHRTVAIDDKEVNR